MGSAVVKDGHDFRLICRVPGREELCHELPLIDRACGELSEQLEQVKGCRRGRSMDLVQPVAQPISGIAELTFKDRRGAA